jgi:hypothetical protein
VAAGAAGGATFAAGICAHNAVDNAATVIDVRKKRQAGLR